MQSGNSVQYSHSNYANVRKFNPPSAQSSAKYLTGSRVGGIWCSDQFQQLHTPKSSGGATHKRQLQTLVRQP